MSDPFPTEGCAAVAASLGTYLDDELGPSERAAVEQHLAACDACRAELGLLRLMAQSLQAVPWPEPPEAMRQRLLSRVAADLAPYRVEILCVEHQGEKITRRDEVRRYREPPSRISAFAAPTPAASRTIQQDRWETASGSGLRCVIARSCSGG